MCLLDITVVHHTEGKAKTRSHHTPRALSESIADIGKESGNRHGILVTIGNTDRAHHHQHSCCRLCRFIPPLFLGSGFGSYAQHNLNSVQVLDADAVFVQHLVFQRILLTILRTGNDAEFLRFLSMIDNHGRVSREGHLLLPGILVLGKYFLLLLGLLGILVLLSCLLGPGRCRSRLLESLVGLLQEWNMVIECFHIEVAVDVQLSVV